MKTGCECRAAPCFAGPGSSRCATGTPTGFRPSGDDPCRSVATAPRHTGADAPARGNHAGAAPEVPPARDLQRSRAAADAWPQEATRPLRPGPARSHTTPPSPGLGDARVAAEQQPDRERKKPMDQTFAVYWRSAPRQLFSFRQSIQAKLTPRGTQAAAACHAAPASDPHWREAPGPVRSALHPRRSVGRLTTA